MYQMTYLYVYACIRGVYVCICQDGGVADINVVYRVENFSPTL